MSESKAIGFKLLRNKLVDVLEHLQAKGTTAAGENTSFMKDCIIRVDSKGIWSITIDNNNSIFAQMRVDKDPDMDHGLEVYNKGAIPLDIEKTLKYIKRFSSGDFVELIYENGLIVLRTTNEKLDQPIVLEAFFAGMRKEAIRNDMLLNTFRKHKENQEERHKQMIAFIKKHHSVYIIDEDQIIVTIYNGIELDNYVELSCNQLKEVVRDGDLLENRSYPFKVSKNKLNVTSKSLKQGERDKLSRDIYTKQSNLNGEFTTDYPSQFNAAVSSTKGHIKLYFGDNKPLLLIKSSDEDYGLSMSYIVATRRTKK